MTIPVKGEGLLQAYELQGYDRMASAIERYLAIERHDGVRAENEARRRLENEFVTWQESRG